MIAWDTKLFSNCNDSSSDLAVLNGLLRYFCPFIRAGAFPNNFGNIKTPVIAPANVKTIRISSSIRCYLHLLVFDDKAASCLDGHHRHYLRYVTFYPVISP